MSNTLSILLKLFVRSFYRENAGAFIFLLTVMFGAVGQLNGAGIVEYHYSLIIGMLSHGGFFTLVLLLWLLYAHKCVSFVTATIERPDHSFLHIFTRKKPAAVFPLFLCVEALLYLPVLSYAVLIIVVACSNGWWLQALAVAVFLVAVCVISAALYTQKIYNREKQYTQWLQIPVAQQYRSAYPVILLRYIIHYRALLFAGIKLYSCGILWLLAKNNVAGDYDAQFPFIFFSFGVFAHVMIIYRLRQFEETQLSFYRGFPVKPGTRFLQYGLLYLLIFLPELLTIVKLIPVHLHVQDAVHYALAGFSLLLALHSLTYTSYFSMKEYLKITSLFFGVVFLFVAMRFYAGMYIIFFPAAVIMFYKGYYRYQHQQG